MADSIVEPSSSASVSSISPLMQNQQQAVNMNVLNSNIIPIISADIQVDTASSQSNPRPPPINQSASNNNSNANLSTESNAGNDEPEAKRKKTETTAIPSTSQTSEKLESRLGGILCCAVCLDLPKTAMYQVRVERKVRAQFLITSNELSVPYELTISFPLSKSNCFPDRWIDRFWNIFFIHSKL